MQNNAPPPPPAKLVIGLPVNAYVLDYKNNALTQYLEKEANCELEFTPYSGGSGIMGGDHVPPPALDALPWDIAWGLDPDALDINYYGIDNLLVDLTPYLADRDGASKVFWDRLEENFSEYEIENIKRRMTDPNTSNVYYLPSLTTSQVYHALDYEVYINTAWLDKLGLPMPTDPESLYDTLVAFKTKDPNGNGKQDELPLFGSEAGGAGADVVNYLVNLFLYFDDQKHFSVDENGRLYTPFITDQYREALQYINKLYAEKLLPDSIFTTKSDDLHKVISPEEGYAALVGLFCGNLYDHFREDSSLLEQYAPLSCFTGQHSVYYEEFSDRIVAISTNCEDPDAAFRLIMKMYEEETAYRIRYGEYGVNWEYAPEGAVSDFGFPAQIKILDDPIAKQNFATWHATPVGTGTLLTDAFGENAIGQEPLSDWEKLRNEMSVQSRKNADAAAANNPDTLCPYLAYTEEELNQTEKQRTDVAAYYTKSRSDFIKNKLDPYLDSDWNAYVKQVKDYGLDVWLTAAQAAYDRVPNI